MTNKEPTITYEQLIDAINLTQSKMEVNHIRYQDVQKRLENPNTSMTRRAELVVKEKILNTEHKEMQNNLAILVDAAQKIERGEALQ